MKFPKSNRNLSCRLKRNYWLTFIHLKHSFREEKKEKKNVENGNWFQIHWELSEYVYKHINGLKCAFISNRSNVLLAEISIYMSCVHVRLCVCMKWCRFTVAITADLMDIIIDHLMECNPIEKCSLYLLYSILYKSVILA